MPCACCPVTAGPALTIAAPGPSRCCCRNAIAERFCVAAPPTLMFDHPTLAALAAWLEGQLAPASNTGPYAGLMPAAAAPELQAAEQHQPAVASIACSFPGAEHSGLAGFWEQAAGGANLQTGIPLGKWEADALYDPDPGAAAAGKRTTYARFAAVLGGAGGGAAAFDADAFWLARGEAALMDPHARLLLELSAEALAGAASGGSGAVGVDVGVYVGCMWATGEMMCSRMRPFFPAYQPACPTACRVRGAAARAWRL